MSDEIVSREDLQALQKENSELRDQVTRLAVTVRRMAETMEDFISNRSKVFDDAMVKQQAQLSELATAVKGQADYLKLYEKVLDFLRKNGESFWVGQSDLAKFTASSFAKIAQEQEAIMEILRQKGLLEGVKRAEIPVPDWLRQQIPKDKPSKGKK